MNKTIAFGIVIAIVAAGAWFIFENNEPSSPTNIIGEQNNNVTAPNNSQSNPQSPAVSATFTITDVEVSDALKLDDGFIVTWKVSDGTNLDANNVFLNFAVVDENDRVIVGHLYGAGVGATFRDQKWTLQMPPLCSSDPVEGCFSGVDPNKKYRLKAVGSICFDKNINPFYCADQSRILTSPAYSNWFSISS